MTKRSTVLRAGLATVLLVPAAGPAFGQVEHPASLGFYRVTAHAPAFSLGRLSKGVELTVPEASASLASGGLSSALAAVAWPGPVVGNLGSTLMLTAPQLPPQVVLLNDPVRAEAHSGGAHSDEVNNTVPGSSMQASAHATRALAQSSLAAVEVPGTAVLGSTRGTSEVSADATHVLGQAAGSVNDVTLLNGFIAIGSVTSMASARSDGTSATAGGETRITGLTINHVPVTVDGSGVHAAGSEVPLPVPIPTLLEQAGVTIALSQPTKTTSGGSTFYRASVITISVSQGATSVSVSLGGASVEVDADPSLPTTSAPQGESPNSVPTTGTSGSLQALRPPPTVGLATPQAISGGRSIPPVVAKATPLFTPAAYELAPGTPLALLLCGFGAVVLAAGLLRRMPDRVLTVTEPACIERSPLD